MRTFYVVQEIDVVIKVQAQKQIDLANFTVLMKITYKHHVFTSSLYIYICPEL
jgi:hypothetical protein